MFDVDILPCMCLAALCSSVGKGAKAQVQHLLDPLFWPSMLCSFSRFVFFFSLSLPLILFNHATIY